MKLAGTVTELEIDLEEHDFDVTRAVVTKERIAIDWIEHGDKLHALLRSSDGGVTYKGNFGFPIPNANWIMEATKFTAPDKSILLLVKWHQSDFGDAGSSLFRLVAEE